ncbi:MAG: hypothetical protein C0392_15760 [Syntrophus sp. (in: bacteria)]|nr:hypothetical protein [Syntrophus sp. (in: bacteria)]
MDKFYRLLARQHKAIRKYFRSVLPFVFTAAVLFIQIFTSVADGQPGTPFIADDEDYKVFAALLYAPYKSQQAHPGEDDLRYSRQPRYPIPGVRTGYCMVRDMTVRAENQPSYGPDSEAIDDFNRKRVNQTRLNKDKLLAALPAGSPATLLAEEEFQERVVKSKGAKTGSPYTFETGTIGFSRVGFNTTKTKAIVVIEWVSRNDNGRYWVKIYRSPENGQWEINYVWK